MMPMAPARVDAPTPRRATLGGKTHRDASARVGRRPRATVTRGGRREASATTSTVGRAFSSSTSSPPMTRATRARALQTTEDTPVDAVSSAGTYDWRAHWYPVAFCVDLEEEAPLTFTLLGEPLVFWRDGSGEMRCVADRCPHRLVPLSEGRVNEVGELECGYHGWTFTGEGTCTSIPQIEPGTGLDTALKSARSCVAAYPTKEAQGMLWVYPTSKDKAPATLPDLPLIPEYDDPECVCQDIFRDLPMDWATLLENVMDVSHVPFTHHNSVGKRENATPVNLELTSESGVTAKGFEGIWQEGPRKGKYGSQYTEYNAPTLMRHTLRTPAFTTLTVVYRPDDARPLSFDGAISVHLQIGAPALLLRSVSAVVLAHQPKRHLGG